VIGRAGDDDGEDDGYASPDFDLPPASEGEVDLDERPRKKSRLEPDHASSKVERKKEKKKNRNKDVDSMDVERDWEAVGGEDLETLALKALSA
jgi:hypothetical protein